MVIRRTWRRVRHLARVGTAFAYFWGGGAFLSWVHLPLVWRRAPDRAAARRRCQEALRRGFGVYLRYPRRVGLVAFDPAEVQLDLPRGPCVLVANHPTILDVVILMAVEGDVCTVVKDYYYQLPMVNRLLRYCGHINGGEGGLGWNADAMEQCLARLRDGQRLLFFPEGTRSPEEGLHPFHRGAFEVARRAGVPVVPVLVRVSRPVLKRGVPWYRFPQEVIAYDLRRLAVRHVTGGRRASIDMAGSLREEMMTELAALSGVPMDPGRGMACTPPILARNS